MTTIKTIVYFEKLTYLAGRHWKVLQPQKYLRIISAIDSYKWLPCEHHFPLKTVNSLLSLFRFVSGIVNFRIK